MTFARSQISLGDYFRAIERLRPDDDATAQSIAELLGLNFPASPAVKPEEKKAEPPAPEILRQGTPSGKDDDEAPIPPPVPPMPVIESGAPLKSLLTPVSTISLLQISPELLEAAQRFPAVVEHEIRPPTPDPLFHPRWTRGIFTSALSTESADGPIDIELLIESLAQREPLAELPRLSATTMRRGLQLLIDLGAGMTPYASDVLSFQTEARLIVGDDGVEVLRFDGSPLSGAGPGRRKTWKEYLPPSQGKPVLALTDLGLNQPTHPGGGAQEWLEFAQLLRHAECPFVVFTPVSASRWPDDLVRMIHIIHWDRSTTAASARRTIGRFLTVKK